MRLCLIDQQRYNDNGKYDIKITHGGNFNHFHGELYYRTNRSTNLTVEIIARAVPSDDGADIQG